MRVGSLSEQCTYMVKEVPTWHGKQDTLQFATTAATSATSAALALPNTPATTSATFTRLAEEADHRHSIGSAGGWREGRLDSLGGGVQ